jgi:hypothetical protein
MVLDCNFGLVAQTIMLKFGMSRHEARRIRHLLFLLW